MSSVEITALQPEREFCKLVIELVAGRRAQGKADSVIASLAIKAAQTLQMADERPEEEEGWALFARRHRIGGAIVRQVDTLVRQAVMDAMEQAAEAIRREMGTEEGVRAVPVSNQEVRAGLVAASMLVKDRPTLDMEAIMDWLATDLVGRGLAPVGQRVDEGWEFVVTSVE